MAKHTVAEQLLAVVAPHAIEAAILGERRPFRDTRGKLEDAQYYEVPPRDPAPVVPELSPHFS